MKNLLLFLILLVPFLATSQSSIIGNGGKLITGGNGQTMVFSGGVWVASNNIAGNAANVTGTVAIANGGTGATSKAAAFNALSPITTLGDMIYGSGTNTAGVLTGNITPTKLFLTQTGTNTASAAPVWGAITAADVPTLNQSTTGNAGTSTKLITSRTIGMTGDVTWTSDPFDGSAPVTGTSTISNGAVTFAKMANLNTGLIGRYAAANGAPQLITIGSGLNLDATTGVLTATGGGGTGTVTAVSVASANGFAGTSSGGATPVLTLSTTITGVLKGNGTSISAAVLGTDYAPPSTGTSILKGNGSGGFAPAVAGTDFENFLTFSSGLTRTTNNITNDLITGIAANQTVVGSTLASGQLTLSSTTNATKGKISFGTASVYTESTNRLGINNTNPASTLHVNQQAIPAVTTAAGTNANTLLTIVGVKGGNTSNSGAFAQGGNGGVITITGGNGGDITGTPTTGIGGNGADINIVAGNGGQGNTNGGSGGNVTLQPGDAGVSLGGVLGVPGWLKLFGANAASVGNGSGANVYIGGGAKNGTGSDGYVYMQVTPSANVRSSGVKIGGISAPVALLTVGQVSNTAPNPGTLSLAGSALATSSATIDAENTITFKAATTLFNNFTLTWPTGLGSNGQFLGTDASGVMSWNNALSSLNGLTALSQTFANGTSGTSPAFVSTGSTHTLNIPLANATGVTAGLISKTQYDAFNAKLNGTLTSGFVPYATNSNTLATGRIRDGSSGDVGATIGGTGNIVWEVGSLGGTGYVSLLAPSQSFTIDANSNTAIFIDNTPSPKGIQYSASYNSTLVANSLVPKSYVDAAVATASGAPTSATYLTLNAEAGLSNEASLAGLGASGLLWSTFTAGTPNTAAISLATTTNLNTVIGSTIGQVIYSTGTNIAGTSAIRTDNSTVGIGVAQVSGATLRVGGNLRTDGSTQIRGAGNTLGTATASLELLNTNTSNSWSALVDNSNNLVVGYSVSSGTVTPLLTMPSTGVFNTPNGGTFGTKIRYTSLGTAITLANNITRVVLDPTTSVTNFTLTLPPSPYDGQTVDILFGGSSTTVGTTLISGTFTIAAGSTQLYQSVAPASPVKAGDTFSYIYDATVNKWWRQIL